MIKVYSHINSSSHFDALWNNQIDRFAKYFTNTRNLAFAYRFKQTAFVTKLYEAVVTDTVDNISEHDLNLFMTLDCDLSQLASVFRSYEIRKKNIKSEKVTSFLEEYEALSNEQKSLVLVPTSLDFYTINMLYGLYPSVRSSFVDFVTTKNLVEYNSKFCYLRLTKYTCTIDDIAYINSSASHSKLLNLTSDIDLKDLFEKVDGTIKSLQQDKQYLEEHVVILSKAIDDLNNKLKQQQQEGLNGYLLTWH